MGERSPFGEDEPVEGGFDASAYFNQKRQRDNRRTDFGEEDEPVDGGFDA